MKERGNLLRHLALAVGALLIAFPEPLITDFAGVLLVTWALRQTLKRRRGAYGACRCDYHHYGPCLFSGFLYLEVCGSLPPQRKIRVEPEATLPRPGLFPLPPRGMKTRCVINTF